MANGEHHTAVVTVTLDEIAHADFEEFLDLIATRAFGKDCGTNDFDYEVARIVSPRSIELWVSAFVYDDTAP